MAAILRTTFPNVFSWMKTFWIFITFLPEARFDLRELSSAASVCLPVCPCVCVCVCQSHACPHDNSSAVQVRVSKFGSQVQSTLVTDFYTFWGGRPWPSRSNLTSNSNFELVRTITCHTFKLVSPNLDQKCILVPLRSLLFWGLIDIDLQGQI